jgi:CheY-like chemotaxis protein
MTSMSRWLKMEWKVSKNSKKTLTIYVFLDVMMPYKDGYTLAKEIREKNKEVPIIFLTAKSMKEDVLKRIQSRSR